MSPPPADPFDTATLRAAVLEAWRSSPTRFREDANVEEDYALGAYRDRLLVELAQNAADAARTAQVPGRLRITVTDEALVVANTGAPLTLAGVRSLAAMRASAKVDNGQVEPTDGAGDRRGGVGQFGVGFAAVLSVTDAPSIVSRTGGVRFSRSETSQLLREDVDLSQLLAERSPPVLRLPFAVEGFDAGDAAGYDTVVTLPWRDDAAREHALASLRSIDDALFIALPDLIEVVIEGAADDTPERWSASREADVLTVVADYSQRRWWLRSSAGVWSDIERAAAPTEARGRRTWSLTWAVPVDAQDALRPWSTSDLGAPAKVVHAPTPTDEPLGLAALLVGDFPVDASRRRLAEGPMTDVVLDAAAGEYVDLVKEAVARHGAEAMRLVPSPDLVGPVDDQLRRDVRDRLSRTAWVPRALDGSVATPAELVAVEPRADELIRVVGPHLADLLAPEWVAYTGELRPLGLSVRSWGDVWDALAPLDVAAADWNAIYQAAQELDRESLEGLPVPLTNGRTIRDPRRAVLGVDGATDSGDALAVLGLDAVASEAAHPLLERLGARPFDACQHLGDGFVRQVADAVVTDERQARELVTAVAELLAGSDGDGPDVVIELSATLVPTQAAEWRPASRVVLPDSPLAAKAEADELLDATLAAANRDGWLALGVLQAPRAFELHDLPLEPQSWDLLMADGSGWCEEVAAEVAAASPADVLATSTRVVAGLEFVERLEPVAAFDVLRDPDLRRAVVEPAYVLDAAGQTRTVRSPAAWWLADAPLFEGKPATEVRLAGDERLAPFFSEVRAPDTADPALLEAMGVHTTLEAWITRPDGVSEVLEAMADASTEVTPELVAELYRALGAAEVDLDAVEVPDEVLAIREGECVLVAVDDVVVAGAPHHALALASPFVPGSAALADLLDVTMSDDATCGAASIAGEGMRRDLPPQLPEVGGVRQYFEHDALVVGERELDWWVTDDDEVHTCTLDGLANALAWASDQWSRRWEFAAKLAVPATSDRERIESYFD